MKVQKKNKKIEICLGKLKKMSAFISFKRRLKIELIKICELIRVLMEAVCIPGCMKKQHSPDVGNRRYGISADKVLNMW